MTYLRFSYYDDGSVVNRYYLGEFNQIKELLIDLVQDNFIDADFEFSSRAFKEIDWNKYVKLL